MTAIVRHRNANEFWYILQLTASAIVANASAARPLLVFVCKFRSCGTGDDWVEWERESTWIAYKCTISIRAQSECAILDFSPVFRFYLFADPVDRITDCRNRVSVARFFVSKRCTEWLPNFVLSKTMRMKIQLNDVIVISISVASARYWHSDSTGHVYTHAHTHTTTILHNTYTWTFYLFGCRTVLDNSTSVWIATSWARPHYHANDCRQWKMDDRTGIHDYNDFYYFWTGREKQKQQGEQELARYTTNGKKIALELNKYISFSNEHT